MSRDLTAWKNVVIGRVVAIILNQLRLPCVPQGMNAGGGWLEKHFFCEQRRTDGKRVAKRITILYIPGIQISGKMPRAPH